MNDHLRADLVSGADTFDLPPGDLGAVVQRARRRNRRRHQLTASLAAVAVVATTVAAIRVADPDDPATNVATDVPTAQLGDTGIEWARADEPGTAISAWSYRGIAELGGRTYTLSTAPGQQDGDSPLPPVLWRSADGVTWEQAATPSGFRPSRLAAGDGRLYAIGTGPATSAAGADLRVGWSDGGDGPWQDATLPIDTSTWAGKVGTVSVVPVDVAADADAVVAIASVAVDLDVPALLPAGETAPNGWYVADDGIDVLGGGPECPAGTSAENPDPAARAKRAQFADGAAPEAKGAATATDGKDARSTGRQYESYCWAPDGSGQAYSPAAGRGVLAHHSWADLGVDGDLLRAVRGEPFLFRGDADGRFERADVAGLTGTAEVEATADGFVLALAKHADGGVKAKTPDQALLRSTDGRTWQPSGDLPQVDVVLAMGTVDGNVALVGSGPAGAVYAELGDGGWRSTSLESLLGAKRTWVSAAAIGPLGVVVGVGDPKSGSPSTSLLASRDGETWSSTSVNDLVGGAGDVTRVVIKDDRAVVTTVLYADGQKARQVTLVGTPR